MKLNDIQLKCINLPISNNFVNASAGSGKTTLLVERIKKQTKDNNKLMVITFTEKASNNFKERLEDEYDFDKIPYMGTFHSVFKKILDNFENHNFFETNKQKIIYDEKTYKKYLENLKFNIFNNKSDVFELDNFINNNIELILKFENIEDFINKLNILFIDKYMLKNDDYVKRFLEKKNEDGIMNFTDIIIEAFFVVKINKYKLTDYFDEILIDEVQDTNKIVFEILKMISNNNLFMVGDLNQSIYSFQGSNIKLIKKFTKNSNIINLNINYRSNKNIINFANDFVNNKLNDDNKVIQGNLSFENNEIEYIENLEDNDLINILKSFDNLEDTVILARNNYNILEIKNILKKGNIPIHYKAKGIDFQLINFLFLSNFYKLEINEFNKDIYIDNKLFEGEVNIEKMYELKADIDEIIKTNNLYSYDNFNDIYNYYFSLILNSIKMNTFEIVLNNLFKNYTKYIEEKKYKSLSGVKIMTIHKSKGLEFENVIIYGLEDNKFPKVDSDEEKRLYYVAITRAKNNLFLLSNKKMNNYVNKNIIKKYKKEKLNNKNIEFIYENIERNKNIGTTFESFINKYEKTDKKIVNNFLEKQNRYNSNDLFLNINNKITPIKTEKLKAIQFDNTELQDIFNKIEYTKINDLDYRYNELTDIIHNLINIKLEKEEFEDNNKRKTVKKILLKNISKKNTNIIKDNNKKHFEIKEKKFKTHNKYKHLEEYNQFVLTMINDFYLKSENERKFYIDNVLGLKNNLTDMPMIDFENNENLEKLKLGLKLDINKEGKFKFELLKGNFILQNKKIKAIQQYAKIKYLENENKQLSSVFLTFTLPSEFHKWKLGDIKKNNRSSKDLKVNPKFKMKGENFKEHIILSGKKLNEIYAFFTKIIRSKYNEENKKIRKEIKIEIKKLKNASNNKEKKEIENNIEKLKERILNNKFSHFSKLENHTNLTPHKHALIWYHEDIISNEFIKITMQKVVEKFNLEANFQDIEYIAKNNDESLLKETSENAEKLIILEDKFNNKEIDVEEYLKTKNKLERIKNNNIASPASYIAKYIFKTAFTDENNDEEDLVFFNAWEALFGNEIKTTTISNFKRSNGLKIKKIYKYYQENCMNMIKLWNKSDRPLYWYLEKEDSDNNNFIFTEYKTVKETINNKKIFDTIKLFSKLLLAKEEIDNKKLKEILEINNISALNNDYNKIIEIINKDYSNFNDEEVYNISNNIVVNYINNEDFEKFNTLNKITKIEVSNKIEEIINNYDLTIFDNIIKNYDNRYKNADKDSIEKAYHNINKIYEKLNKNNNINLRNLVNACLNNKILKEVITIKPKSYEDIEKKVMNNNNLITASKTLGINIKEIIENLYEFEQNLLIDYSKEDNFKTIYEEDMYSIDFLENEDLLEYLKDIDTTSLIENELKYRYNYFENWKNEYKQLTL